MGTELVRYERSLRGELVARPTLEVNFGDPFRTIGRIITEAISYRVEAKRLHLEIHTARLNAEHARAKVRLAEEWIASAERTALADLEVKAQAVSLALVDSAEKWMAIGTTSGAIAGALNTHQLQLTEMIRERQLGNQLPVMLALTAELASLLAEVGIAVAKSGSDTVRAALELVSSPARILTADLSTLNGLN